MPASRVLVSSLIALFVFATPARLHAQTVCTSTTTSRPSSSDSAPDLVGVWDFRIEMESSVATGTMALGIMDDAYAGALTPDATNTVAIRRLVVRGDSVHMAVATREGDVTFDGRLASSGSAICGVVHYHGGKHYSMTATHRPRARRP